MDNYNQKSEWNQFVVSNNGSFLQSWEWGEFQESLGRKIWRIETDGIKALVIRHDLPLGKNYLYCPRGPITSVIASDQRERSNLVETFIQKAKQIAKQEKSIFLKIEPTDNVILNPDAKSVVGEESRGMDDPRYSLIKSQKEIQPSKTIILDLSKTEQDLLNQMHHKTRYNIKLSERKGVIIRSIPNSKIQMSNQFPALPAGRQNPNVKIFYNLLQKTAKRDKFHLHPREYYQKMMDVLGKDGMIKLFVAEYKDKIIAANLICFFGNTVTYLHGASDYDYHKIMAPHLLQWRTILKAKEQGFKYYDFWGIDEKKWPGITRFKRGFNGKEIAYPGTYDLVFRLGWYKIYNLARRIL